MLERRWASSDSIGSVYVWPSKPIYHPVNEPKPGTWFLCVEHSGDNFYDYVPLKQKDGVVSARLRKAFGTYGGFKKAPWQPTNKEFHLLLAGLEVEI